MKVLVLNNRFPSRSKPFVASYIKSIGELLVDLGHDVEYLVHRGNSQSKFGQLRDLVSYNTKILTSERIASADLLVVNHFHLYWNALRKKVHPGQKMIIHWHGSEIKGSKHFQKPGKWLKDPLLLNAHHIFPSIFFKKEVFRKVGQFSNWKVIPSGGVNMDLFKSADTRRNEQGLTIGYASHLSYPKGVDFFLRLVQSSRMKSVHFKAINYGDRSGGVAGSLREAGVELVEPLSKQEMPTFYNQLDMLIFPTRSESLGLVPLEAMACGVPVISPQAFACPEYTISGQSGEGYLPDDFRSFIAAVDHALENLETYAPREVVKQAYSQELVYQEYVKLLSTIA